MPVKSVGSSVVKFFFACMVVSMLVAVTVRRSWGTFVTNSAYIARLLHV